MTQNETLFTLETRLLDIANLMDKLGPKNDDEGELRWAAVKTLIMSAYREARHTRMKNEREDRS